MKKNLSKFEDADQETFKQTNCFGQCFQILEECEKVFSSLTKDKLISYCMYVPTTGPILVYYYLVPTYFLR